MSEGTAGIRGTGVVLLVLALGAGAAAARFFGQPAGGDSESAARAAATKALVDRTAPAVESVVKTLEPLAAEAAQTPELLAAFETGVDAATFQDAFESEDWWRRFRENGRFTALYAEGKVLANVFLERPGPAVDALLARLGPGRHLVSGLVQGDGRVYAMAASRVDRSKKAVAAAAVVLLGTQFDQGALTAVANLRGVGLAISNGQRLILTAGPAPAQAAMANLAGREPESSFVTTDGLMAAATNVGSGLWLWSVSSLPPGVGPKSPAPTGLALAGLAGLLAIAGLVLLMRKPAPRLQVSTGGGDVPAAGSGAMAMAPTALARDAMPEPIPVRSAAAPSQGTTTGVPAAGPAVAEALAVAKAADGMVGRYTLVEKIGEGGMAEVFRSTLHGAEGFERQLVIKRLHPHLTTNKDAVSQFIDEAQLQSGLSHSNIVPVFDFGRAGQDYFLALEYIQGRDLDKVVQRHVARLGRPLEVPMAAFIINEVLAGLAHAHRKADKNGEPMDLVHRDVSLGNILISYVGEVKLSDFGIVKSGRRVSKTQVGMVKGNAGFMAPEQARGEKVDARADLFSTGVVLYCCLTGQPLYQAETVLSQLMRAAVGPGTAEYQQMEAISADVATVLTRALALDPARRFATATEFSRAVRPLATVTRDDLAQLMRILFEDEIRREQV